MARLPSPWQPTSVTIVCRPLGDAPEWVRDAWIGLRLPLAYPKKRVWGTLALLPGPHGFFRHLNECLAGRVAPVSGYAVDARTAVDLLAGANPAAAAWWHSNVPTMLKPRRKLVFGENACRPELGSWPQAPAAASRATSEPR